MSDTTAEVPGGCTCPWEKRAGDLRWRRLGIKEDCPNCGQGVTITRAIDPWDYPPEWLDDTRGP